jgi:ApaG protein
MEKAKEHHIEVSVETAYIPDQSVPEQNHYVFSYTITIRNQGNVPAKLINRHWVITDESGQSFEVKGEGVVGHQPYLRPGEQFRYTSGTMLETAFGSMTGSYEMHADDGTRFNAEIPVFYLSVPRIIH